MQVVFPFGGEVYEVLLPPAGDKLPIEECRTFVREEATTVLQCLMRECEHSRMWQHLSAYMLCSSSRHAAGTPPTLASHVAGDDCRACVPRCMCAADHALVEQQRAVAASSLTGVPCIASTPFELHGSRTWRQHVCSSGEKLMVRGSHAQCIQAHAACSASRQPVHLPS